MKMRTLYALVATGVLLMAGNVLHKGPTPSPVVNDLPASQWWPQSDQQKGPPGGDA